MSRSKERKPKNEATNAPQQVNLALPPSRTVLVLGVDAMGRLYHQMHGEAGLVEVNGLMAYGNYIAKLGFEHAFVVPNQVKG
jgi:hypothetical protein